MFVIVHKVAIYALKGMSRVHVADFIICHQGAELGD